MSPRLAALVGETRGERLLNLATLLYFTTLIGLAPYVPQLAVDLGAGEEQVALLAPAYAVTAIFLRPLTGVLSDRGYTRGLLVAGSLLNLGSQVAYAASASLAHVYAARLVQGAALALFIPASLHAASMAVEERARRNLVARSIMVGLGASLGPALGGVVLSIGGWRTLFGVGALLSALALALVMAWESEPQGELARGVRGAGGGVLSGLWEPSFIAASLGLFLFAAFYMSIAMFLPALHREVGLGNALVAVFFSLVSLANLFSRTLFTRLQRVFSPLQASMLGVMSASLGVLLVALEPTSRAIAYAAPLVGAGLGLLVPGLQILALTSVPYERRGMAASIYTTMFDAASLVGPPAVALAVGGYVEAIRLASLLLPLSAAPLAAVMLLARGGRGHPVGTVN